MVTFNYLSNNVIGALELLRSNHENLMLGGVISSVIEFLGRCLESPTNKDSPKNFYRFIDDFLAMQNPLYGRYKELLYKDLRCGSAHTIMAKGGVTLSYDPKAVSLHLSIKRRLQDNTYQLWIYSPYLIEDMKGAIVNFIQRAGVTPELKERYIETIKQLQKEGQENIKKFIPKEDLLNAEVISARGDIII